jgi:hypothetical protein
LSQHTTTPEPIPGTTLDSSEFGVELSVAISQRSSEACCCPLRTGPVHDGVRTVLDVRAKLAPGDPGLRVIDFGSHPG